MKKIFLLVYLFGFINLSCAQEKTHTDGLDWKIDFKKAQKIAKKENKPMLLLFTGSDWCPPCKAMHRDLFSDKDFIQLSKKFILVMVDFPKRKQLSEEQRKRNYELADKYHRGGVPTIVFVNPDGSVITKLSGYRFGHPERHIKIMKEILEKF